MRLQSQPVRSDKVGFFDCGGECHSTDARYGCAMVEKRDDALVGYKAMDERKNGARDISKEGGGKGREKGCRVPG